MRRAQSLIQMSTTLCALISYKRQHSLRTTPLAQKPLELETFLATQSEIHQINKETFTFIETYNEVKFRSSIFKHYIEENGLTLIPDELSKIIIKRFQYQRKADETIFESTEINKIFSEILRVQTNQCTKTEKQIIISHKCKTTRNVEVEAVFPTFGDVSISECFTNEMQFFPTSYDVETIDSENIKLNTRPQLDQNAQGYHMIALTLDQELIKAIHSISNHQELEKERKPEVYTSSTCGVSVRSFTTKCQIHHPVEKLNFGFDINPDIWFGVQMMLDLFQRKYTLYLSIDQEQKLQKEFRRFNTWIRIREEARAET